MVSTVLASVAMIINYLGTERRARVHHAVLMTGITAAIPYGFSALAQIKWRRADRHDAWRPRRFVRDLVVAVVSLVFSVLFIWYSRNTGQPLLGLLGPVLPGRRRPAARHPGLPLAAPSHDPARARPAYR